MSDREKSYVLAGQLGHIVAYLTLVNQTNKQHFTLIENINN